MELCARLDHGQGANWNRQLDLELPSALRHLDATKDLGNRFQRTRNRHVKNAVEFALDENCRVADSMLELEFLQGQPAQRICFCQLKLLAKGRL